MKQLFLGAVTVIALSLGLTATPFVLDAGAANQRVNCTGGNCADTGANRSRGEGQSTSLTGSSGVFRTVTNVLLFLIGTLSVIMLVIGGIRYTVSNGDSNQLTAAKNTIMYSIVGLIVAIVAYAIVEFVVDSL